MKKIIPSFLLAVSAGSSVLYAQSAKITLSTSDLSLSQYSNINDSQPQLMMNPATAGKGVETLAESLGVFGKRVAAAEMTSGERQALSVTAGGTKTIGGRIDEEEDHDSEADEATSVNKYLKNEIINNIYAECLAEVANLSLEKRKTAEGSSTLVQQEAAEWAEAKMAADVSKRKAERGVRKAQRETLEARTRVEEAKRNARDAARTPKQAHEAHQAVLDATIAYEKTRVAYTSSDCEAKRLAEIFAEARVETADAVLYAISSHNTTLHTAAETELDAAKEAEMDAFDAAEAAKADIVVKEDCMRIAERKLIASKKSAEEIFGKITGEGVGVKVSSMMKELEFDQRIAEEALAKAKKSDLTAIRLNAMAPHERDFDKEVKAYNDTIEAWAETAEGYKIVLEKAAKAHIDCSELMTALHDAEEKKGNWVRKLAVRTLQSESENAGRIAEAASEKASASLVAAERLSLWETAQQKRGQAEKLWTRAVEAYQDLLNQAPESLKSEYNALYINELKVAENTKAYLSARDYYCEAFRASSVLLVALEKAKSMNGSACEKPQDISLAVQAGRLWEEVHQKRDQAIKSWDQTVQVYERMRDRAQESFKASWTTGLEDTINNKNLCVVGTYYDQAIKANNIAELARSKAVGAPVNMQSIRLWEEEKQARAQEERAWMQSVEAYRGAKEQAPSCLKDKWILMLNFVSDEKAKCEARFYWNEANRIWKLGEEAVNTAASAEDWEKVKQARLQEEGAWSRVISVYENMKNQALDSYKTYWNSSLQSANNQRNWAAAKAAWAEAYGVGITASNLRDKGKTTKSIEILEKAQQVGSQEERSWSQAEDMYKRGRDQDLAANQAGWDSPFEDVIYKKNCAAVSASWCGAYGKALNTQGCLFQFTRKERAWAACCAWEQDITLRKKLRPQIPENHKEWWNEQIRHSENNKASVRALFDANNK